MFTTTKAQTTKTTAVARKAADVISTIRNSTPRRIAAQKIREESYMYSIALQADCPDLLENITDYYGDMPLFLHALQSELLRNSYAS